MPHPVGEDTIISDEMEGEQKIEVDLLCCLFPYVIASACSALTQFV
jgi:hypothetical protein